MEQRPQALYEEIDCSQHGPVSRDWFAKTCLIPNRPAILRNWSSTKAKKEKDIDLASLQQFFSARSAQQKGSTHLGEEQLSFVELLSDAKADGRSDIPADTGDGERVQLPASEIIAMFDFAKEESDVAVPEGPLIDTRATYPKDWHFVNQFLTPNLLKAREAAAATKRKESASPTTYDERANNFDCVIYAPPKALCGDYLNSYCLRHLSSRQHHQQDAAEQQDEEEGEKREEPPLEFGCDTATSGEFSSDSDYRFVYLGNAGTWTQLHFDVCGSYSWSYNVLGSKLWLFPYPEHFEELATRYAPGWNAAPSDVRVSTFRYFSLLQHPGDLVFVPSMCYHQVHNLSSPTLSVNHNWCNVFNLARMAQLLRDEYNVLAHYSGEEDTVRDMKLDGSWWPHAHRVIRCNGGWNVAVFKALLGYVGQCVFSPWVGNNDEKERQGVEETKDYNTDSALLALWKNDVLPQCDHILKDLPLV